MLFIKKTVRSNLNRNFENSTEGDAIQNYFPDRIHTGGRRDYNKIWPIKVGLQFGTNQKKFGHFAAKL